MKRLVLFFKSASAGGIILILASILGIILANTSVSESYFHFLHMNLGPFPVHIWINDVLMAVFFLYVGLEVKREMLIGQLNSNAKRLFPGLAALCGFLVPALLYFAISKSTGAPVRGWAIPTATDIAFALGVLTLLESRVPISLKIFLTALAVIDDLMAIVVIAIFYSSNIEFIYIIAAAIITAMLIVLNKKKVYKAYPYIILGIILWYCVFNSGLHATMAGVILALTIPLNVSRMDGHWYPLIKWEHTLSPWVTFLIVPVFGFANAGVSFGAFDIGELLNPIVIGIAAGLFIGKQLGIFSLMLVMVKTKLVPMPEGANWRQMYGLSVLCGIGFTMSLFVSMLAFKDPRHLDLAKVGVFMGTILSAVLGSIVLGMGPKVNPDTENTALK